MTDDDLGDGEGVVLARLTVRWSDEELEAQRVWELEHGVEPDDGDD